METCTQRAATSSRLDAVSSIPAGDDVLDPDEPTYDLPRVAELLGVPLSKVHQQLREGHLIAVRRHGDVVVPRIFFTESGEVVKSLPGLLMVLHDGGFRDTEIMRWLFTPDPSLTITHDGTREAVPNARPVDALHAHQAREVVRRAQAMAY
ncbi:DNA-binding protein [Mycobacterium heckeshornense]|uniref:DNA-binding protein n=1 Tax=Mycobacterium heckeshornense TaxID=110505 RepID=A0A7R7YRJ5_9MYCO|nr:DNA-binding protein [Mycobacterium heckeshornense]BCQ08745.1 DNA-binding protein [Mycobacterium heckeshornense]